MHKHSIKELRKTTKVAKKHVTKRLLLRLQIFVGIFAILLGVTAYNIFFGNITFILAVIGLFLGIIIGLLFGNMYKVFWQTKTQKVVSQIDKVGTVFLIIYIIVEINRKWFFGHWLEGAVLNAFGLIFLSGVLLGRFLTISKNIKKVLVQQNKIK
jgi:hypothetical protein